MFLENKLDAKTKTAKNINILNSSKKSESKQNFVYSTKLTIRCSPLKKLIVAEEIITK